MPDPNNPQTFNRYSYVLNNPFIYTDPSGKVSFLAIYGPRLAVGFGAGFVGGFEAATFGRTIGRDVSLGDALLSGFIGGFIGAGAAAVTGAGFLSNIAGQLTGFLSIGIQQNLSGGRSAFDNFGSFGGLLDVNFISASFAGEYGSSLLLRV